MNNSQTPTKSSKGLKFQLVLLVLCPVAMILLCSVVICFYASSFVDVSALQTSDEESTVAELKTREDTVNYLKPILEQAFTGKEISVSSYNRMSLESFNSDMNTNQSRFFEFVVSNAVSQLNGEYENVAFEYGEKAELFDVSLLDDAETLTTEISDDKYISEVVIYDVPENFYVSTDKQLFADVFENFSDIAGFSKLKNELGELRITIHTDTYKSKLISLEISRSYEISGSADFLGDFSVLGSADFSLVVECSRVFEITYAGIEIEQDKIYLTANGYENLSIIAGVSDNALEDEFTLTFSSSAPQVAVVDENGVVEAENVSESPAIITATLEYLGKIYEDSVEVFVLVEAESVSLDKKDAKLTVGETIELNAEVKPKNATVKTVNWYSLNEQVATVDESGNVTATGVGETEIIAITENGENAVSCEITVTQ